MTEIRNQPSAEPYDLDVSALAESPLQQINSDLIERAGIRLLVKRDDLIHPLFGGNKWRKLKYNLIHAGEKKFDTLLTFGGAWSNHIYATAAAGRHFGFNTIGLIRGEEHLPLNPTLTSASECGMKLYYLDRTQYRNKNDPVFLQELKQQFGDVYLLPEGGSNLLAMQGCADIVSEIDQQSESPYDVICCACGTGATLAGIITALSSKANRPNPDATQVLGFSALKGGAFLVDEVTGFLGMKNLPPASLPNWSIEDRFHFGGYARIDDELKQFMKDFEADFGFSLDAVYTAKMFYGLFQLIKNGRFSPGNTIITVHSGGLQGNKGFNLYT